MTATLLPFENKNSTYAFIGWSTVAPKADGTLADGATLYTLESGLDTIAVDGADITLYAVWSARVQLQMPGASIRTQAPQGLRFLTIDNVYTYARGFKNIERSTLIIPTDLLTAGTSLDISTANKLQISAQNYRFISDLSTVTANAAHAGISGFAFAGTLVNIPQQSYDRSISAVGCVITSKGTVYTSVIERSVYVVSAAIIEAQYPTEYANLLTQVESTGKSIGQLCFEKYFNF